MNPIPIIYQNEEIFIINKKAGMPVQGGEKISHSLDEELAKQVGQRYIWYTAWIKILQV